MLYFVLKMPSYNLPPPLEVSQNTNIHVQNRWGRNENTESDVAKGEDCVFVLQYVNKLSKCCTLTTTPRISWKPWRSLQF